MIHTRISGSALAIAMVGAAVSSPAQAATAIFTGSFTTNPVVGPSAGCAPRFRGQINSAPTMTSLGAATYSHTVCTAGPAGGPVDGTFSFNFGDDFFEGTLLGSASTAVNKVSTLNFVYTVLGGTGRFADATGSFTGTGTADITNIPSTVKLAFNGSITAAGVPEPGTWALMILGFGALGGAMRQRQQGRLAFA